jgi:hypothetical protein
VTIFISELKAFDQVRRVFNLVCVLIVWIHGLFDAFPANDNYCTHALLLRGWFDRVIFVVENALINTLLSEEVTSQIFSTLSPEQRLRPRQESSLFRLLDL